MFRYAIPKVKKANHIITTTNYIRDELIKLGFNESKIHVVHDISAMPEDGEHWKISILSLSEAKAYEQAARYSFERYVTMRKKRYKEDIFEIFSQA